MAKYIDNSGLLYLWGKLKEYFVASSAIKNVALSGSYNDLLNKPSIPEISVSISDDATSDTKGASPKSVKTYVDTKVSGLYKPSGSVVFASLPALASDKLGNVYNVTDSFTTTSDFVEGSGKSYPSGTNVVIVEPVSGTYKFDVLSGFVDLSSYYNTTNLTALTNAEIDTILAS